jgi:enoyl-CoA hydratase
VTAEAQAELEVRRQDGCTHLVLQRPQRGNSLSAGLVRVLTQEVEACANDGTRLLVLEGAGSHFCTGFDLSALDEESDDSLLARFVHVELLLQLVHRASFATLALARGRAFGAGADLFAACEQRWIVGEAQFSFPGAAFGLVLGTARLARRVGTAQARQWVRSGEGFDAQAALQTGFASRLLQEDELKSALASLLSQANRLDDTTMSAVHAASLGSAEAEDAVDLQRLVQSAARPGLRERIAAYRAAAGRR